MPWKRNLGRHSLWISWKSLSTVSDSSSDAIQQVHLGYLVEREGGWDAVSATHSSVLCLLMFLGPRLDGCVEWGWEAAYCDGSSLLPQAAVCNFGWVRNFFLSYIHVYSSDMPKMHKCCQCGRWGLHVHPLQRYWNQPFYCFSSKIPLEIPRGNIVNIFLGGSIPSFCPCVYTSSSSCAWLQCLHTWMLP